MNKLIELANRYFNEDVPVEGGFTVTVKGYPHPLHTKDGDKVIRELETAIQEAENQFGPGWESVQDGTVAITRVEWIARQNIKSITV